MVDFLGQPLSEGDFVVIVTPYGRNLSVGVVKRITNKNATILFLPGFILSQSSGYAVEDKEAMISLLLSDDPSRTISSSRPRTLLKLRMSSRCSDDLVKIDKSRITTFLEGRI